MVEGDPNVVDWQTWEDWTSEPKMPDGMEPAGPWYPFAAVSVTRGEDRDLCSCVIHRRPLRKAASPIVTPTTREHDRERCEAMWSAAGKHVQESGDRRDWDGTDDAEFEQQNYAIALDIHRGAGREKAIAELRRRYDVLAGYLMLRGGTDFVNACRAAIVEERWCDLVESIARLEWEHMDGKSLRWGKDADGNRIAEEIEPGRYHIPANLYPGHPFDAAQASAG